MNTNSSLQIFSGRQTLRKALKGGVSLIAFAAMVSWNGTAMAAGDDSIAVGAVAKNFSVTTTDTNGLLTTDYDDNTTMVIDTNAGAIVLGAVATNDAISYILQTGTRTMTLTVTTTSTNNLLTFAGDIHVVGGSEILAINVTNTTTLFQGDVTKSGTAIMTIGSGSSTLTTTFDTSTAADNIIDMAVKASAANDTITMAVTDTQGGGNTITFSQAIGGASTTNAIDVLTLGANTVTIFTGTVRADTITNSSTGTTTFNGDITGALNFAADGTVSLGNGTDVAGAITTSTTNEGTLSLVGGTDVTLTGAIGASGKVLKAITTNVTGEGAGANTFTADVYATTMTITGTNDADEVTLQGDFTGNIVIATGALITVEPDKKIVGAVTATDGVGILTFETQTATTTLVSGDIGVATSGDLLTVNVASASGITSTFGGKVNALSVDITGTGTIVFSDDVDTDELIDAGDATYTIAANKKFIGSIDTDAGAAEGTFNFAATTTDTTLVSGTVGDTLGVKVVTVAPASGVTATFTGNYSAVTTTHSGAGTVAYSGTVGGLGEAADIDISGGGTVTLAASMGGSAASDVDNTSGSAGSGTLTMAAGIDFTGNIGATNSLLALNVDSAGTSAFTGTVAAATVTLAGTGSATFSQGITASTAVNFTADGTATIAADKGITGTVTTGTDGEGTLTFTTTTANTTLVSGGVGSSSAALKVMTAGENGGATATIQGNIFVKTINISNTGATGTVDFEGNVTAATAFQATAAGIITFSGSSAQTITGALTNSSGGDNVGDITVSNTGGTVTFTSTVGTTASDNGMGDMTLNASTTTVFKSTVDVEILSLSGASTFKGAVTADGALTLVDGATITVDRSFTTGQTVINAAGAITDGGTISIIMSPTIGNGETITVIDAGSGTTDATYSVTDTGLFTYAAVLDDDADTVIVTATKRSASDAASTMGVTSQEATALFNANSAVASGDSAGLDAMETVLNTGGAGATKAAEQVSVQADTLGADTAAAVAAGGQVLGAASTRLASLRSGAQYASTEGTGFATGGEGLSKSAWFKPFGNLIRQGTRNNIKGYDADTYGVAFGIDGATTKNVRLGVSFAYSNTDVDGKGTGNSETDVESYQGMVYGDYTAKTYYVEGMIAYARNDSDTTRSLNFGGLNRTIIGNYNSNQYMAKVSAGAPSNISGATFMTPTAGLSWTHVSSDNYTETGGGGYNQIVNPEDNDVIVGSVGIKIHTKYKMYDGGFFIPELRGSLNYDFAGDEAAASATFTGGGAAFNVTGAEVAQLGGHAGIGLTIINGAFSVAVNYDAEIKDDYVSHSGTFEARIKF